jgi:hypothetical protein
VFLNSKFILLVFKQYSAIAVARQTAVSGPKLP